MNRFLLTVLFFTLSSFSLAQGRYGEQFCNQTDYFCLKITKGQSWEKLFPNEEALDIVKRVNRMNIRLSPGMVIAVPKNLDKLSVYDVSPFPRYISGIHEKTIYVSQKDLAWAAYDSDGELVWWGPVSPGQTYCPNVYGGCGTPSGDFRIIDKQDADCISTTFPMRPDGDNGGAQMPYCMPFFRGYALHGSDILPGYRASHGCVRMFIEDARWLNEEFIDVPDEEKKGTRVVISESSS